MNVKSNSAAVAELVSAPVNIQVKQENGLLTMLPLEDFPHGELLGSRKDALYDIDFYSVPSGVKVISYDEKTGKKVWAEAQGWSVHRGKEIELVTLHNNKTIITDDDPRAIYGVAKDSLSLTPERFTPSEALKRQVCVPQLLPPKAEEKVEDNSPSLFFDWTTGEVHKATEPRKEGHLISEVDFDFGQFLGIFAGDGWWDKVDYSEKEYRFHSWANATRQLCLSDNEGDNAEAVKRYLLALCPHEVKVNSHAFSASKYKGRFGDTVRYTYIGEDTSYIAESLSLLLDGHGDEKTSGSGNKKMPAWLLGAPRAARFGFLCGILSTDGSISLHKHARENRKPQLLVNLSSTSLFLIRDVNSLCSSLGIQSTITFSKITQANNVAWLLNFSTPSVKACEKEMLGMANKRKLDTLRAATVIDASKTKSYIRVLLTDAVADIIMKWLITGEKYAPSLIPEEFDEVLNKKNIYNEIHARKKDGYVTPKLAHRVVQYALQEYSFRQLRRQQLLQIAEKMYKEEDDKYVFSKVDMDNLRGYLEDLFPKPLHAQPFMKLRQKLRAKLNDASYRGYLTKTDREVLFQFSQALEVLPGLSEEPLFKEWVEKIVHGDFSWAKVMDVQKTGEVVELNDLTVPGYETFVSADGIVLSNTINLHVPSSDEAVKEAWEKLMPSDDPFSDRDPDKVVLLPKQEQILGNYTAATAPPTRPVEFNTEEEALTAIKQGQIPLSADVVIRGGVKMASQKENAEIMGVKGPIRDPRTGQWITTVNEQVWEEKRERRPHHVRIDFRGGGEV